RSQQVPKRRTFGSDGFQAIHLRGREGRLDLAHAIIRSKTIGQKTRHCPVCSFVPEPMKQRTKTVVVRRDQSSIAARDVLGRLERETSNVADRADGLILVTSTPGLSTVLDQDEIVLIRECLQFVQLGRISAQVYRDDGLGFGSNQWRDSASTDLVGV